MNVLSVAGKFLQVEPKTQIHVQLCIETVLSRDTNRG